MAYTPITWKDRAVEKPRTYTIQDNGDGTVTLIPAPGTVYEGGTPVNAGNMNHIEQGIAAAWDHANRIAEDLLPAGTDFNIVTKSGFYRIQEGNYNAPPGSDWGTMVVTHKPGTDTISQLVFAATAPRMWVRTGNPPNVGGAGAWSAWVELITSAGGQTINGNLTLAAGGAIMFNPGDGLEARWISKYHGSDVLNATSAEFRVQNNIVWHTGMLRINNGVLEVLIGGEWIPVGGGGPLSESRRLASASTAVPQNTWTTLIDLNMRGRVEFLDFKSSSADDQDPSTYYTATYRITMDGKVVSTPSQFVTTHPGMIFTYLYNPVGGTTQPVPAPIYFNQRFLLEAHFDKPGNTSSYTLDYRQAY
ncbi:pyocin knob domain-containing protein [Paenibacillus oceani]|uniref:Tail fiber protein n=1 Tax=Paenibacillus oceani TaxID=2772510 RepID=A0A927C7R8_9BACL|nr:pyocin knob domain-containing protein [Paenibacillus oceani]MBD2861592.1 hypothetical protein [Paenibacillus oceani]